MRRIYAITVDTKRYTRLSGECYDTLEKAQDFCCQRRGIIRAITPMWYRDEENKINYKIHELILR